jgi:hypothetical protein
VEERVDGDIEGRISVTTEEYTAGVMGIQGTHRTYSTVM